MNSNEVIENLVDTFSEVLTDMGVEVPSDTILELEIKSAIGVINRCRRFTPTDDKLYDEYYADKIIPLAVAGYLKTGAEGENAHSENGINRIYGSDGKYPKDMLSDIIPLAKFI